jgi:hypothetical protein
MLVNSICTLMGVSYLSNYYNVNFVADRLRPRISRIGQRWEIRKATEEPLCGQ